jgi:hypothetical protein
MRRSDRTEKLPYSGGNLEKRAGENRPLNPGNIQNLEDYLPDDSIGLVVISFGAEIHHKIFSFFLTFIIDSYNYFYYN